MHQYIIDEIVSSLVSDVDSRYAGECVMCDVRDHDIGRYDAPYGYEWASEMSRKEVQKRRERDKRLAYTRMSKDIGVVRPHWKHMVINERAE